MDGFEALTEAMNRCVASLEQLANAIRQSETQCGKCGVSTSATFGKEKAIEAWNKRYKEE